MTSPQEKVGGRTGSLLIASLFILIGIVTLYDTTTYTDIDSKVFPRTAAIILIVCSLLSMITGLLKPINEPGFGRGSWWRRFLLVITMLVACALMPHIGFLYAGFIAFGGGMLAAMHQSWNTRTLVLYVVSGVMVMVGFYSLFRFGLNVPLP